MTDCEIEHITFWLMIKCAIIFYIITIPFKIWAQNKALKKIETMLQEGEEIIYKPKFNYIIEIVLPLGVGGWFGCYILPFYLYPEIQNIRLLNRNNLFIGIIVEIICLLVFLYAACWRYAITNKRIISVYVFNFIYKFGKTFNLYFKDIKAIKHIKRSLVREDINIIKQNNKITYLSGFKNMKKIKLIIEEQIEKVSRVQ